MISGIIGGQSVKNNPILRAPSVLLGAVAIPTGSTTSGTVNTSLRTAAEVSATQSTTSNADLVNVSGKGVLLFCAFHSGANIANCVGTITIDGVVVYNAVSSGINSLKCPVGVVTALDTTATTSTVSFEAVPFYTSLRIQYRSDSGGNTVGAAAKYRLAN